jgi:hypothetical protein
LHLASGNIHKVINSLNGDQPINTFEVVGVYTKWRDNLALLEMLKG